MNPPRNLDGSAGDANYGLIGKSYSHYRQAEPRIARILLDALGAAKTVLNIGAGAGSYEPADLKVTPLEPSEAMRRQRPPHLAPAINGVAEHLPFADKAFDACMATFTIHQWEDLEAGLSEARRVTQGPVVLLTCDPALVQRFWLNTYAPGVLATEAKRYPSEERVRKALGGTMHSISVPIPLNCRDGFNEAYYGRPEMLLDPEARLACSAWSFISEATASGYVASLESALRSKAWDKAHGHLRSQPEYQGSLVAWVGRP
jgi:SAM-dependent methyltransferase